MWADAALPGPGSPGARGTPAWSSDGPLPLIADADPRVGAGAQAGAQAEAGAEAEAHVEAGGDGASRSAGRQCLIIDDDPLVRLLLVLYLTSAGFEVVGEATSAADALTAAASLRPDIVLVDLKLPDSDGLVTVAALRSVLPGAWIVVLSGLAAGENETNCLRAGADHYLDKSNLLDVPATLERLTYWPRQ